jgi:hypothetical protein
MSETMKLHERQAGRLRPSDLGSQGGETINWEAGKHVEPNFQTDQTCRGPIRIDHIDPAHQRG